MDRDDKRHLVDHALEKGIRALGADPKITEAALGALREIEAKKEMKALAPLIADEAKKLLEPVTRPGPAEITPGLRRPVQETGSLRREPPRHLVRHGAPMNYVLAKERGVQLEIMNLEHETCEYCHEGYEVLDLVMIARLPKPKPENPGEPDGLFHAACGIFCVITGKAGRGPDGKPTGVAFGAGGTRKPETWFQKRAALTLARELVRFLPRPVPGKAPGLPALSKAVTGLWKARHARPLLRAQDRGKARGLPEALLPTDDQIARDQAGVPKLDVPQLGTPHVIAKGASIGSSDVVKVDLAPFVREALTEGARAVPKIQTRVPAKSREVRDRPEVDLAVVRGALGQGRISQDMDQAVIDSLGPAVPPKWPEPRVEQDTDHAREEIAKYAQARAHPAVPPESRVRMGGGQDPPPVVCG